MAAPGLGNGSRMTFTPRVLDREPVTTFAAYLDQGGGRGLEAAAKLGPLGTIDDVEASGLRGRGGAGFPTGVKWRTVADNRSSTVASTVVVNGAEGEPGSFKDRAILRANPYRVLEGALIAALAVGADTVVVALKASFVPEIERVRAAIDDVRRAGWAVDVDLRVHEGPSEYLYGEETALLESVNGRAPFPRVAPPYRHGVEEMGRPAAPPPRDEPPDRARDDAPAGTPTAAPDGPSAPAPGVAGLELAGAGTATPAAPTLVNNVESMANVAGIMAEGPDWFRAVGTDSSPGTSVCTISGATKRHGVAEVPMGTPLRQVIEDVGGGSVKGRVVAVMSGVANPLLPAELLDTAVDFDAMAAAGSGLGAAGFIVFDEDDDLVAVAHGVSRFLAVESCGQCTPCKQDGGAMRDALDRLRRSEALDGDLDVLRDRLVTVTDGARCYLASQ